MNWFTDEQRELLIKSANAPTTVNVQQPKPPSMVKRVAGTAALAGGAAYAANTKGFRKKTNTFAQVASNSLKATKGMNRKGLGGRAISAIRAGKAAAGMVR